MGTGIAEVCALGGYDTVLLKATGGDPEPVRCRVEKSMNRRVERGKLEADAAGSAMQRLNVTTDRDQLVGCDLVIESIIEDINVKRTLFADLADRLGDDTILASNTSTLKLDDMCAANARHRTIGLHFFSPVPAMRLVELAHLPDTLPEIREAAGEFVLRIGKTAVPVADSAGFVVNRLLVPYLIGAMSAYSHGLARADQIDEAMKLGCGHPVGPLMLCDLIGLDIVFAMAKLLYHEFKHDRFQPPAILRRLVQAGNLGKKTGLGFYDHSARPALPNEKLWSLISGDHDNESQAA